MPANGRRDLIRRLKVKLSGNASDLYPEGVGFKPFPDDDGRVEKL